MGLQQLSQDNSEYVCIGRDEAIEPAILKEVQELQLVMSSVEEILGNEDIVGIREDIYKLPGMSTLEGGRLPRKGGWRMGLWRDWKTLDLMN